MFISIESYVELLEKIDARTEIVPFGSSGISGSLHITSLGDLRFVWYFVSDSPGGDSVPQIPISTKLISEWSQAVGSLSPHWKTIRSLDQDDLDYSQAADALKEALNLSTVLIWSKHPTDSFLHQVGSTFDRAMDANTEHGLIGEAIRRNASIYIPNISYLRTSNIKFQHPKIVAEERWKGFIVCPLFSGPRLVGIAGLYSKSTILLSRREVGFLAYALSAISKKLFRDAMSNFQHTDLDKMYQLAPTLYVGMKSSYRLHSLKNAAQSWGRRLGSVHDLLQAGIQKKSFFNTIDENALVTTLGEAHIGISDIAQELESLLKLATKQPTKQHFKHHNLRQLADDIAKQLIDWSGGKRVIRKITYNFPEETVLFCDKVSLEQACYNVIDNATYFLETDAPNFKDKRKPEINLSINAKDGVCTIEVQDNALGMTDEEKEKAKQMYYSGSRKDGTGLGLWMTDRIAHDHKGNLAIKSGNTGTVATITLPAAELTGSPITGTRTFGGDKQ